jgi:carboxyl-terminal processing protease
MVKIISSTLALECSSVIPETGKKKGGAPPAEEYSFGFRMAVLVNRYTARFCEALAAELQDRHAGVLIGEKTYGIGSQQDIFTFRDKYALKLTISYFRTTSGRIIMNSGIEPDIRVQMEPVLYATSIDTQLEEAKSRLKGTTTPGK